MDQNFIEGLQSFSFDGNHAVKILIDGVPYFIGEFWTAKQRQGHSLHEISYRACFKPQLPEFFISRLTSKNAVVYDPFMGRGTTPLQAALMGRKAIGNDINPLSEMLVRPRFLTPSLAEVEARLGEVDWAFTDEVNEELLVFYHPETLREIQALRAHFLNRELDKIDDWIRMVAISRLTGHSSGFFSVYTLPPNRTTSINGQIRINEKREQIPPRRNIVEIIMKKSKRLLKQLEGGSFCGNQDGKFFTSKASNTSMIRTSSVDLVITSPPFLDIIKYGDDNWLRCWFAGINVKNVEISKYHKVEKWREFICSTFNELARVVKSGGHVAFEVGEVNNGKIELDRHVLQAVKGLPFEPLAVVVNSQDFTKTANCWGVSNGAKGTNSNRIVVFRRG